MKRVLIYGAVKHAIEKAKEFGYYVIVVDQNDGLPIYNADEFKKLSFDDLEANLEFAKEKQVDGIVNATDYAVIVSSYVAEQLGFPGLEYKIAKLVKNKYDIRKRMQEKGITSVPQFFAIHNKNELEEIKDKIKFPIILKPANGLGSLHVYRIDNFEDLNEKIEEVIEGSNNLNSNEDGTALIETFIEGQEYGVETFVYDGKVHILAVMKKEMTELPFRSELGHIVPSGLDTNTLNEIEKAINDLINALGIKCSAVNFDLILSSEDNKPYIVDVGARMGGNGITSHIVPLSTGIDHVGNIIKYAMQDDSIDLEHKHDKSVVTRILNMDEGTIKELPDFDKYKDEEVAYISFEKKVGDTIEKYISDAQRCGFMVVYGNILDDVYKKANNIKSQINNDIIRE